MTVNCLTPAKGPSPNYEKQPQNTVVFFVCCMWSPGRVASALVAVNVDLNKQNETTTNTYFWPYSVFY